MSKEIYKPVYELDYENLIIGCMFTYPKSIPYVFEELVEDDFYDPKNRIVFGVIKEMFGNNEPIDMSTIYRNIVNKGYFKKYNIGVEYFNDIQNMPLSTINLTRHILTIKELSIRRDTAIYLREKLNECSNFAIEIGDTLKEISNISLNSMIKLIGDTGEKSLKYISQQSIKEMYERIENANNGKPAGIPIGLTDFDNKLGGFRKQDVIILAGRPGMGKTAFALFIARKIAHFNFSIGIFSLEMGSTSLMDRMIISESQVNINSYKYGRLSTNDTDIIEKSVGVLCNLPIYIDDKADVDISYIKTRCNIMKSQGELDAVIIDYMQLIGSEGKEFSREREVAKISRMTKIIAKELDIPIIMLSQLNRQNESRADKKPILSDLRESGAIEQDADKVIFIHRPEYYELDDAEEGVTELIVAKNRNGATGEIKVRHTVGLTNYYDYEQQNPF